MIVTKKKLCLCLTITFIIIVLLIAFILYFFQSYKNINYKFDEQQKYYDNRINNYKNTNNNEINNRLNYFDNLIQKQHQEMIGEYNKFKSKDDNDNDKICMTQRQFDNITKPKPSVNRKDTIMRDYRVVKDDLFPPFNRSDNNTHTDLTNNIMNRSMYVNTNNVNDTFRLVGYVTSTDSKRDSGNNSWKLFGRQKDRHFSEFYISPTNNNNDVKIFLTDNIIVGDRVRDIYAIPNNITFRSPMLNESPYQVVEIPKQDISYNALNYM
tara:strand:+ start:4609 stop:5409 length:801 start_codon:yes stop_codon:yes gene_type:complete